MASLLPSLWSRHDWPSWSRGEEALDRLYDDMERSFHQISRGIGPNGETFPMTPRADMRETESEIVVTLDLPGIDEKNIDVSVGDDHLVVKATISDERESQSGTFHVCERRVGSIHRSMPLPCEVEEEKVQAEMKNGVLTVTLPKTPASKSKTRKIKVKHAA